MAAAKNFPLVLFTFLVFLSGIVTATIPGYVDKCPDGTTCCPSSDSVFASVSTTVTNGTCTPDKVCCKETTIPMFNASTEITCGDKSSTVTATIDKCPDDASKYCLHVYYAPFGDGTKYTQYSLQLSENPISSSSPGTDFSDTCEYGEGQLSINCYVPVDEILLDPCSGATLYIAANAICDGGDGEKKCWLGPGKHGHGWPPKNWDGGKGHGHEWPGHDWQNPNNSTNSTNYFSGNFSCEITCEQDCTCACPPPGDKYCEQGTGFAFNPKCGPNGENCTYQLNNLPQCPANRWGWWFEIPTTPGMYMYQLYEGAGNNDISAATLVGTVSVSVTATDIVVTYTMNSPYAINTAHIDLRCSKSELECAPGQYSFNSGCLDNKPMYQTTLTRPTCSGGYFYMIFHADVTVKVPSSDMCQAVTC